MNELYKEYLELSATQIMPSVQAYADAWRSLGDRFKMAGANKFAALCHSRAEFYFKQGDGEHIRIIEGSLSELLEV